MQVVGRGGSGIPKAPGYSDWDPMMHSRGDVPGTFTMLAEESAWRALRRSYGPAIGPAAVT